MSREQRDQRVRRVRADRERIAPALGAYRRQQGLLLAAGLALIGLLLTIGHAVGGRPWGVLGGVLILAGAATVLLAERRRVDTINPEDAPGLRRHLAWLLSAAALVGAGFAVLVQPW